MQSNLDKPISTFIKKITVRHVLIAVILILTIFSRLIDLDVRVMSHDEVNHVVPSFDFYSGRGYQQSPITHGPLQFHFMALSYFLFGDNDFTSRLPHAIFSIATVAFVIVYFRRYLGKFGSIAAGIFFAISPFMMYYGRYARNEAICAFLSVAALYLVLRYLEEGRGKHLYLLIISLALNFTAKETAYIFTAQMLIFLLVLSIKDFINMEWASKKIRKEFFLYTGAAILIVVLALGISVLVLRNTNNAVINEEIVIPTFINSTSINIMEMLQGLYPVLLGIIPATLVLFASLIVLLFMRQKLHWDTLSSSRAFTMMLLVGTMVLPLLSAFPVMFAGIDPTTYTDPVTLLSNYIYITYFFGLSIVIGSIWNPKSWWKLALTFFGIYFIFFTTFFSNSLGILSGLTSSLGHWLAQQDVERGGQPIYYFALIQIPIYEFLGAAGTILAFFLGIKKKTFWNKSSELMNLEEKPEENTHLPVPAIFIFWSITSLIAYSLAGEKMPWLTVHIAFSMLLAAGWYVNQLLISKVFQKNNNKESITYFIYVLVYVVLILMVVVQLFGNHAPFQGKSSQALRDTNHFLFLITMVIISTYFLFFFERSEFNYKKFKINVLLALFLIMAVLTARSAYRASFINYDYPLEYLVYAHASDGPKIVLDQVEEISMRLTGGLDIKVAYDNHGLYPYWWYFRNYPNKIIYLEDPTRTLEDADLIIAGSDKYGKIDTIVRDNFYYYEYTRIWWPMQDYWNLTGARIWDAISNADMRQALFDIWFNRDYKQYALTANNQYLTLDNWLPSEKMRFYVRKDIAAQMWQLNTEASLEQSISADLYSENMISIDPIGSIGTEGTGAGELNTPHGLAISPDGYIFVADSVNNRIQKFDKNGNLLGAWGKYANAQEGDAPGGTMNEPWDIAIGKDGSIFVADTFNHRIQKLTADGEFVKMWGIFAQGSDPESFWGPRGIAVDNQGNVLVTDTGNKRILVFDQDLNFITQFGGTGFEAGEFDEPVGIAISKNGLVAVADTWNRRVQVFEVDDSGLNYTPTSAFDVEAWYGTGIENKPYITFSPYNTIFISDPDGDRILEFTIEGEFVRGFQDLAYSLDIFSAPYGLVFDQEGKLWVSEVSTNMILRFDLGQGE